MADEAQVAAPDAVEKVEKVEETKPETIGEIIGTKEETKPEPKLVPEAAFLELKKSNKALEREVKDLRTRIEGGATEAQLTPSIQAIAEKYEVKPEFLNDLSAAIRKDVEAEAEQKIGARLKPFEDKDRAQQVRTVFDKAFDRTLTEMDEYKGVVNKDTIFALSLIPTNASKTLPQLIEETYGSAITGKRSIETTVPRGGAAPGELDMNRANTDADYLREVLSNPTLKKQFDEKVMEIARRG
jgi:hypothetical protein